LGNQLARPLLMLADGVRQVAQGDLSVRPVLASRDELGGLTRSFADMTGQLLPDHPTAAIRQSSLATTRPVELQEGDAGRAQEEMRAAGITVTD